MRRFARNAMFSLCVLAAAGVVFLWFRSTWRADVISRRTGLANGCYLSSGLEGIKFTRILVGDGTTPPDVRRRVEWSFTHIPAEDLLSSTADKSVGTLARQRFDFSRQDIDFSDSAWPPPPQALWHQTVVAVPHWFVLLLTLSPPGAWLLLRWLRRRRGRSRADRGLCVSCGYDLRGSPGRCPECGQAPA